MQSSNFLGYARDFITIRTKWQEKLQVQQILLHI